MPIPVAIPGGPLVINDTINARAEAMLAAFAQAVAAGTTGASLNTPASTTANDNDGTTTPVLIDTDKKQLFFRQEMLALASFISVKPSLEVAGSTADPTTASSTYVVVPEMSITLSTTGNSVLVQFSSSFNVNAADSFDFSIFVDGSEHANAHRHVQCATAIAGLPSSTQALITGLGAGNHTFDVRWKASSGSARALGILRSLVAAELS